MVLCTVHKVSANSQPPILPQGPQQFLDKDKFDGKKAPEPAPQK